MSDIQYVYPLIHNKVTSPHYVTPTLRRARLIDWLNENAGCRAVVIAADAGYGKTTLLWQWEREVEFPCYWYKLDRNDRDWSLHISYLIESISQRHPGFGRRAHSMLEQLGGPGSSRPGVAAYLLAEMHERLKEPCTFIIDDWQFVASVTEVRGLWNQILRDAPPTCRFVFLSRAKPQLQFARFKTHGGYAEMRTDALRFNDREIEELFRDIYNDPLDPTELAELERRTEGWAASLQLVEVSLRERHTPEERRSFIQSITATTDSDLFDYLAEEVFQQQDDRTRDFLLVTAILQQIEPELAGRLAGVRDGGRVLAELEQRGLFTYRLDADERFRYHVLFRDFLERKLAMERTEGEIAGLHIHAASYFETSEEWPAAIHHYLCAGLQPQAARLISRYGESLVSEGRLGLIDEWLHKLPRKATQDNARLSLLLGEALGMRGDWDGAFGALARAERFFTKKGDRRMVALSKLKLSTVLANQGRVEEASKVASSGLQTVPNDATDISLRLRGNLAITAAWLGSPFEEVIQEFKRIVVEAKTQGWDHFAAIGLHNLGAALRHVGRIEESVRTLELASQFWGNLPASPFADNAELVSSLLAAEQVGKAETAAIAALLRTEPWPRPNAEARFGLALVRAYQGKFGDVSAPLIELLANPEPLGPTADQIRALLVESLYLAGEDPGEVSRWATPQPNRAPDPRLETLLVPVRAIARHISSDCGGQCLAGVGRLRSWEVRGATWAVTLAHVKLGALALEHMDDLGIRFAHDAIRRGAATKSLRTLRWWLRRYVPHAQRLAGGSDGIELVVSLADADPEGWRDALVPLLRRSTGRRREILLDAIRRHATKQTALLLDKSPGADVAVLRRTLIHRHAARLMVRTFGPLTVHRGGWTGPTLSIDRRRTRTFLGLLAAYFGTTLTRDMVLDLMWPDADPSAAVNNLNQTVFQVRRTLDPSYRDGSSPQYIVSGVDTVQFNPDLVRTDLSEFRRLLAKNGPGINDVTTVPRIVDLVRGQFLADLRYEDWVTRIQTAVHAEVRQALLPVAISDTAPRDLSIRAASALIDLDEFDDAAYLAMANHLDRSGRRTAARQLITRYAERVEAELATTPSLEITAALANLRTRGDHSPPVQ